MANKDTCAARAGRLSHREGVHVINEYLSSLKEVGKVYQEIIGKNYPAMALVQVAGLVEVRC